MTWSQSLAVPERIDPAETSLSTDTQFACCRMTGTKGIRAPRRAEQVLYHRFLENIHLEQV